MPPVPQGLRFALHEFAPRAFLLLRLRSLLAAGREKLYAAPVLVLFPLAEDLAHVRAVHAVVTEMPQIVMRRLHDNRGRLLPIIDALLLPGGAGLFPPGDVVALRLAVHRPDQPRLHLAALADHPADIESALVPLAPAGTSPEVGFNETVTSSFVIRDY